MLSWSVYKSFTTNSTAADDARRCPPSSLLLLYHSSRTQKQGATQNRSEVRSTALSDQRTRAQALRWNRAQKSQIRYDHISKETRHKVLIYRVLFIHHHSAFSHTRTQERYYSSAGRVRSPRERREPVALNLFFSLHFDGSISVGNGRTRPSSLDTNNWG